MATFDEIFGNILDGDLEGIFNDVSNSGALGNLINNLTGFDPASLTESSGTKELRDMVEEWKKLQQQPFTRTTLSPTLPNANVLGGVESLVPSQYERPDLDFESLPDLNLLDLAGYDPTTYDPTLLGDAAQIGGSAAEADQARILEELMKKSEEEGFTDSERMMFNQILQGQATQAARGRDAALSNMQQRGLAGSGMEAVLSAMANQGAAGEANRAGIQLGLAADEDNLAALQAAGGLAGQMRSQDLQRQSANVNAINLFNRINADTQTAAAARNAMTQTEADRFKAQQQNLAKQQNIQTMNRQLEENNRLANESLRRQYEAELQANQIFAQREMEAGKFNISTQMEIDQRNQAALNAFEMAKAQMANDFAKENVDNQFRIEQEENNFDIKRLTGQGGASKALAEALFAEQKANLLKRAIEQQTKPGQTAVKPTPGPTASVPGVTAPPPPGATQPGQPLPTQPPPGQPSPVGPSGPGGAYRPGDTIQPGSDLERQLEQGYQRDRQQDPYMGGTGPAAGSPRGAQETGLPEYAPSPTEDWFGDDWWDDDEDWFGGEQNPFQDNTYEGGTGPAAGSPRAAQETGVEEYTDFWNEDWDEWFNPSTGVNQPAPMPTNEHGIPLPPENNSPGIFDDWFGGGSDDWWGAGDDSGSGWDTGDDYSFEDTFDFDFGDDDFDWLF